MKKAPKKRAPTSAKPSKPSVPRATDFDEVLQLIDAARVRTLAAANTALIDLYWQIGEHISRHIASDGWGKSTVETLAEHIQQHHPNARGFSASNLWRMMQFFDTYRALPILAPLVRQLSWTHNLLIMSRSKRDEEREMAIQERWSKREPERQLNGALFERVVLSTAKVSPAVRQLHQDAASMSKHPASLTSIRYHEFSLGTGS